MGNNLKLSEFKSLFFNPRVNKKILVKRIKLDIDDFDDLQKFLMKYRAGFKSAQSLLDNALHGRNPLPKKYEDLNKNDPNFYSGSIVKELNWAVASLIDYSTQINCFLKLQSQYEDALFKGDYENARSLLKKVETDICVSFWGIENRFILDEYELGTEENWNTRKLFLREGIEQFVQAFSNILV